MTIEVLHERGCSNRAIARTLGVDEKAVRYRLSRLREGAADGRAGKPRRADGVAEAIAHWMGLHGERPNGAALHACLVTEHGYEGSVRSIERFVRAHYPRPRVRARRRVETPPGAQAQVDWAEFPGVRIREELGWICTPSRWRCRGRARTRGCGRSARISSPGSTPTTRRCGGFAGWRR